MLKFLSHVPERDYESGSEKSLSKAFVKENDDAEEERPESEGPQLPEGAKNYITPKGAERLRSELHELVNVERPKITEVVAWAASNGDRSENADYIYGKRRLREIDRRIRFLTKRLEIAEVVDPAATVADTVRFGATVRVSWDGEEEKTFLIVGVDEIDAKRGRISWISPLGRALLKSKAGDVITFRAPKGDIELEILDIQYVSID